MKQEYNEIDNYHLLYDTVGKHFQTPIDAFKVAKASLLFLDRDFTFEEVNVAWQDCQEMDSLKYSYQSILLNAGDVEKCDGMTDLKDSYDEAEKLVDRFTELACRSMFTVKELCEKIEINYDIFRNIKSIVRRKQEEDYKCLKVSTELICSLDIVITPEFVLKSLRKNPDFDKYPDFELNNIIRATLYPETAVITDEEKIFDYYQLLISVIRRRKLLSDIATFYEYSLYDIRKSVDEIINIIEVNS